MKSRFISLRPRKVDKSRSVGRCCVRAEKGTLTHCRRKGDTDNVLENHLARTPNISETQGSLNSGTAVLGTSPTERRAAVFKDRCEDVSCGETSPQWPRARHKKVPVDRVTLPRCKRPEHGILGGREKERATPRPDGFSLKGRQHQMWTRIRARRNTPALSAGV